MKLDAGVLFAKGWCIITGAGASGMAGGLSQLLQKIPVLLGVPTDVWILLFSVYAVMMTAAISFMSSSFGDFVSGRKGTGNTTFLTKTDAPPITPQQQIKTS